MSKNIRFKVKAGGCIQGRIRVPGDKSVSHRSIMLGSIADGITNVAGFLEGDDSLATLKAFQAMGVKITGPDHANHGAVTIHGVGLKGLKKPAKPLDMGNSGTAMRLMAGILAGQDFECELIGDESLSKRPMKRVTQPLSQMGADIETATGGMPPIKLKAGKTLQAMDYTLPMASAQVKSCVILAAMYAEGTTTVIEPAPTRDHTERMLNSFGYPVKTEKLDTMQSKMSLSGGGRLTAMDIDVPTDISSAAFFMVAAAIAPKSDLVIEHVGINPTRTGIIDILKLMGANISLKNKQLIGGAGGEPVADVHIKYAPLTGIKIPKELVPLAIDEFPVLFVAASVAKGQTVLSGAEELRVKECDRIQVMADALQVVGIDAQPTEDGMVINGGEQKPQTRKIQSHHDHRISMAMAVAGLTAVADIIIEDCANVNTSFPTFVELANQVGLNLEVEEA